MITKSSRTSSSSSAPTRKRTHLKPHQLSVLQSSFALNPLPDGTVRSQLAHELGVSERTIQIWFQNRRAKARKTEAAMSKSLSMPASSSAAAHGASTSNGCHPLLPRWAERAPPRYQPTFRTMMTPERFEELHQQQSDTRRTPHAAATAAAAAARAASSKPAERKDHADAVLAPRAMSEGIMPPPSSSNSCSSSSRGPVVPLMAHNLRIGSWTRFATHGNGCWDLACEADPAGRQMVWQVQADGHLFRIQLPFDAIQQLRFVAASDHEHQLEIDVADPQHTLAFSMQRTNIDKGWTRCGDFSEGQQASLQCLHVLQGGADLQQALLDLTALVPDLAAKCLYLPTTPPPAASLAALPMLDDCREFTLSPSATPEPFSLYDHSALIDKWPIYTPIDLQYPYGFC